MQGIEASWYVLWNSGSSVLGVSLGGNVENKSSSFPQVVSVRAPCPLSRTQVTFFSESQVLYVF